MATYLSKAMARITADSRTWKVCIKNIWVKQAEGVISLPASKKILNKLGKVERERPRSESANMAKKRYIGTWRVCSCQIAIMIVMLPTMVMRNMAQNGVDIQRYGASSPGMPVTRKVRKTELVLLTGSISLL